MARQSGRSRPLESLSPALLVLLLVLAAVAAGCGGEAGTTPSPTGPAASSSQSAGGDASPAPVAILAFAAGAKGDTLAAMAADGSVVVLVPGDGRPLSDVRWSPDGRRIGYLRHPSYLSSETTLMVYDVAAETTAEVAFGAAPPAMVFGWTWVSPTELVAAAFASVPRETRSDGTLYRCDVAAGSAEPLRDSAGAPLHGQHPSASADGRLLAYLTFAPGGSPRVLVETLALLDLPAGTVKTVARARDDARLVEAYTFGAPLLSPDGTLVYTRRNRVGPDFSVGILAADGAPVATLGSLAWPSGAAWDPSGGDRVVFGGSVPEYGEPSGPAPPRRPVRIRIWDAAAAGGSGSVLVRALRRGPLRDFAWSPDGRWVAFTVASPRHDYATTDLYVMRVRGGHGGRPALVRRDAGCPSWALAELPGE